MKDAQTQVRDERARARTVLHSAPIYWHGDNCKPRTLETLKRLVLRLTIQRASHEQGQPEAESDPEVDDVPEKCVWLSLEKTTHCEAGDAIDEKHVVVLHAERGVGRISSSNFFAKRFQEAGHKGLSAESIKMMNDEWREEVGARVLPEDLFVRFRDVDPEEDAWRQS